MVRLLLDGGASVDGVEMQGGWNRRDVPLVEAVKAGPEAVVRLLLDRGASVDGVEVDQGGWNRRDVPLVEAAKAGQEKVVRLLLDWGASVDGVQVLEGYMRYSRDVPLVEAVKAGHEAVVRVLLNGGASVDGVEVLKGYMRYSRDVPLVRAVKAGHEAVVRLLLDGGASVDGVDVFQELGKRSRDVPLVEAAKAGHEEVVRLLLNRGASLDGIKVRNGHTTVRKVPVVEAAKAGHDMVVRLLHDFELSNQITDSRSPSLFAEEAVARARAMARLPVDQLDILLVNAATYGQISKVRLLLQEGADINAMTLSGTALSAAARAGHDCIARLLLRHGADVETAALILRDFGAESAMIRLCKIASWVRNGKYTGKMGRPRHYDSGRVQKLRYLHRNFIDQHTSMIKASQGSSTEFRELSERFRDYREAWAAGIRTMRGLRDGEAPGNTGDTIAFLCLARAMSETLRNTGACDFSEQFRQDLFRWQVIFTSEADLDAFREAIHSMWGLEFDKPGSYLPQADPDEALKHFQTLALTLISEASESLGFDALADTGLECSQQRWRMRNGQALPKPDLSGNISNHDLFETSTAQFPEATHPRPPDPAICSNKISLSGKIETDLSSDAIVDDESATMVAKVTLLMAGAIFGIVLLFLQCSFTPAIQPSQLSMAID